MERTNVHKKAIKQYLKVVIHNNFRRIYQLKITDFKTMAERIDFLQEVVKPFQETAREHDENGTFPVENINKLREINYPALTVPKKYGGLGISLEEMVKLQSIISEADGSTGLSIGWHLGITKHNGKTLDWGEEKYKEIAKDIVEKGAVLNNVASERATGSPTRGGKPETYVQETEDGWIINGRKSFATMSPVLDFFLVSASIDGTDDVASFLVRRKLEGVSIDETWDSVAMAATGSHDLVLKDVKLAKEDLLQYLTPGKKPAQGWLLHIPACYIGIARAAQKYAINFATSYSPTSIKGTISEIPAVQQRLGEMELRMIESEALLYSTAKKWDQSDAAIQKNMHSLLGATKLSVVNKANEIVDLAMRIVGARSLSASCPLQRYYRDVRAGLHNPPMDDMTITSLAKESINKQEK